MPKHAIKKSYLARNWSQIFLPTRRYGLTLHSDGSEAKSTCKQLCSSSRTFNLKLSVLGQENRDLSAVSEYSTKWD